MVPNVQTADVHLIQFSVDVKELQIQVLSLLLLCAAHVAVVGAQMLAIVSIKLVAATISKAHVRMALLTLLLVFLLILFVLHFLHVQICALARIKLAITMVLARAASVQPVAMVLNRVLIAVMIMIVLVMILILILKMFVDVLLVVV